MLYANPVMPEENARSLVFKFLQNLADVLQNLHVYQVIQ